MMVVSCIVWKKEVLIVARVEKEVFGIEFLFLIVWDVWKKA